MEIKIIITDAGPAGHSENSVQIGAGSVSAGAAGSSDAMASMGDTSETGASARGSTSAQASAGAMDAGPAPAMGGFYEPGVPQPFVAQRAANVLPHSSGGARSTDESGGAAPGSGAGMETSTAEVHHG